MQGSRKDRWVAVLFVLVGSLALAGSQAVRIDAGGGGLADTVIEAEEMRQLKLDYRNFLLAQERNVTTAVEIVESAYEAFAAGDAQGFVAVLDPQVSFTERAPIAGTFVGPDAVLNGVIVKLASEWEGLRLDFETFIEAGDTVIVQGSYSATYRANGKSLQAPFVHVWQVRNGKVVKYTQYTDTLAFSEAMAPGRPIRDAPTGEVRFLAQR